MKEVYIDEDRLLPGYRYNEALAKAICQSICMIVVYTPRYERHNYCLREFTAMERIERSRREVLGNRAAAFVTKLNARGSALAYSTFLGGTANDQGEGIAVDRRGRAYVTGGTFFFSDDFPTTPGAFDNARDFQAYRPYLEECVTYKPLKEEIEQLAPILEREKDAKGLWSLAFSYLSIPDLERVW